MRLSFLLFLACLPVFFFSCPAEDEEPVPMPTVTLQLRYARVGSETILGRPRVTGEGDVILGFNLPVAERSGNNAFDLSTDGMTVATTERWNQEGSEVTISLDEPWAEGQAYTLVSRTALTSPGANPLPEVNIIFSTAREPLRLIGFRSAGVDYPLEESALRSGVSRTEPVELVFSHDVGSNNLRFTLTGPDNASIETAVTDPNVVELRPSGTLPDLSVYSVEVRQFRRDPDSREFGNVLLEYMTAKDDEPDFPVIDDEALLTLVQEKTFRYFWDFAEPNSGMARERTTSGNLVTSGGSGFGLMAMVVGVERGFITLDEAVDRWKRVTDFLGSVERFHGAWSHWINGETGAIIPFSELDNGGDLVETAFLVQGLLTVREYLAREAPAETDLIARIDTLWRGVEWDWYLREGDDALSWHWSPDFGFQLGLRVTGHNETQIIYTLAAASPTHPIAPEVYVSGYARSGAMVNGNTYFDTVLPLGDARGGPLFFSHYSYLGMDPRELSDQYANYWEQNVAHSRINQAYCVANPQEYYGYSQACWGLTASDGFNGYSAHSPNNDRGVITPTAALSSMPYTPEASMAALKHFYYDLGDRLWSEFGFVDAFSIQENWTAQSFLAIDQGPIVIMIENHRTGLLWDLYMSNADVTAGLDRLGFNY